MAWSVGAGLDFKGVIVTGAAGGIGRPVAAAFATAGARVLAVDRDEAGLSDLFADLDGDGHATLAADLSDVPALDGIVQHALHTLGRLDVLVNVAAVLRRQSAIEDVTEDDWDLQHTVNLKAVFFLARSAALAMVRQGHPGSIVNFTSQGWWSGGFGGSVAYSASKGGVVSLTRGLARTFGPHGINVNAIAPGQVRTPMLLDGLDPAVLEAMREQTPLGYVAEPEELAGTVVFLASDHARYITGATINVTGGFLMY